MKIICVIAVAHFLFLVVVPNTVESALLQNIQWQIEIEPTTLKLQIYPFYQPTVVLSRGTNPRLVTNLVSSEQEIEWQWDHGLWHLHASLHENDLHLTIHADQSGWLSILEQPSSSITNGLILPLAEGHYVPKDHTEWQSFLLNHFNEIDTNEDLKLPLWGLDQGNFTLHWILTNPFNNLLTWRTDAEGAMLLSLSHEFTSLDYTRPFSAILHLADKSLISGAKRYRKWLIDQNLFEPMVDKLKRLPNAKKLLGATHTYLWGNGPFAVENVKDWDGMISKLHLEHPLNHGIRERLGKGHDWPAKSQNLSHRQQKELIRDLNQALSDWAREEWQQTTIDYEYFGHSYGSLFKSIEEHLFDVLHPGSHRWGGGLSSDTIEQLQASNLTHLWLGLADGWEGGLWHPHVVEQAVAAGYLIAPYDSYETALPQEGMNRDWSTAYLGAEVYSNCGIKLANGEYRKGFLGQGYYTNPNCVRPVLQKRIRRLKEIANFNSWFLDGYATGMVFDDHRSGESMSQAKMAEENVNSMRWTSDTFQLVVGSEDGNSVTARGLLFAHGMQTPVIGWYDSDLQTNKSSPYYLGSWFPSEEPSLFFKSVRVKDIYKTVHYDSRYRLPLYQAVFHDSVITTHHWLFDNLKFSDVFKENILVQLLYNVPSLFHISRGTLAKRLPIIQHLDQFFKPLHQRLATQALTDFRSLTSDGSLQETEFADGTRIVANFANRTQNVLEDTLAAYSVNAYLPDGSVSRYIVSESVVVNASLI